MRWQLADPASNCTATSNATLSTYFHGVEADGGEGLRRIGHGQRQRLLQQVAHQAGLRQLRREGEHLVGLCKCENKNIEWMYNTVGTTVIRSLWIEKHGEQCQMVQP